MNKNALIVAIMVAVVIVAASILIWDRINRDTFVVPLGIKAVYEDEIDECGEWMIAKKLDSKPELYFHLKDPDNYTLTAIHFAGKIIKDSYKFTGKWVLINGTENFMSQVEQYTFEVYGTLNDVIPITVCEYEEQFYDINIISFTPPFSHQEP